RLRRPPLPFLQVLHPLLGRAAWTKFLINGEENLAAHYLSVALACLGAEIALLMAFVTSRNAAGTNLALALVGALFFLEVDLTDGRDRRWQLALEQVGDIDRPSCLPGSRRHVGDRLLRGRLLRFLVFDFGLLKRRRRSDHAAMHVGPDFALARRPLSFGARRAEIAHPRRCSRRQLASPVGRAD